MSEGLSRDCLVSLKAALARLLGQEAGDLTDCSPASRTAAKTRRSTLQLRLELGLQSYERLRQGVSRSMDSSVNGIPLQDAWQRCSRGVRGTAVGNVGRSASCENGGHTSPLTVSVIAVSTDHFMPCLSLLS